MKKRRKGLVIGICICVMLAFASVAIAGEKVNINSAGQEELMQLEKIGPSYADRIIEYREKNGKFEKPEDILKVKGIGPKTYELNKDRIAVN